MMADTDAPLLLKSASPDYLSVAALIGLPGLVITVLALHYGPYTNPAVFGIGLMVLAGLVLLMMWRRNGVRSIGLRIDRHGLSGLVLPVALRWTDIESVSTSGDFQKGYVRLGIKGRAVVGQREKWRLMLIQSDVPRLYFFI